MAFSQPATQAKCTIYSITNISWIYCLHSIIIYGVTVNLLVFVQCSEIVSGEYINHGRKSKLHGSSKTSSQYSQFRSSSNPEDLTGLS